MLKVLLIIPAYNEEKNILKVYKNIQRYNRNNNGKLTLDCIIINDGSRDNTKKICIDNNIPYIDLFINLGIGGAVQTGYKYAKDNNYDVAIQFDGDGQHDINYIKDMIKPITNNEADMVIGSRFVEKNKENFKSTRLRRIGINIISFFIKLFTGKKIYDVTSGFRACNKKLIEFFAYNYPHEYPEPITTLQLLKKKYRIKEIFVHMNERTNGVSSIKAWKPIYYMISVVLTIIVIGIGGNKNAN